MAAIDFITWLDPKKPFKRLASDSMTVDFSRVVANSMSLTTVPSADGDVVDVAYVKANSLIKPASRVATAVDINVANPPAFVDGIEVNIGEYILLVGQTDKSENGLWAYTGANSPLERPSHFPQGSSQEPGTKFPILDGTYSVIDFSLYTAVTVGTTQFDLYSASSASRDLSNLLPTSINQSLVPEANGTLNLGNASLVWATGFMQTVSSAGSELSLLSNGSINANGSRVTNSSDPIAATDLATKQYVDNLIAGIAWKKPVFVASNAPLDAYTVTGMTLTSQSNGPLVIDGEAIIVGERALIKDEVDQRFNGIYEVINAGSVSSNWTLSRAEDSNTSLELRSAAVYVTNGTSANSGFVQTESEVIVGTSPINFTKFTSQAVAIGSAITGATSDKVLFVGNDGTLSESANLAWNGTTFGVNGSIKLNEVTISTGTNSDTYNLVMPTELGVAGSVLTDVAGDGILSWMSVPPTVTEQYLTFSLSVTDIGNEYVVLPFSARNNSIQVVISGTTQRPNVDFVFDSNDLRLYFGNGAGAGPSNSDLDPQTGNAALVVGDVIEVYYNH